MVICIETYADGRGSDGASPDKKREESEVDALREEVEAHRENNDLLLHECKIVDHEHPPLPMIKGSYGN